MESHTRLDRPTIVQATALLAEDVTLDRLTLHQLARSLGVKPPSLYNHVHGLDDLYAGLAALGMQRLGTMIAQAAIGKSQAKALTAVGWEYRAFARTYPELYKAILKVPKLDQSEVLESENVIVQTLFKVLEPYHYTEEEALHRIRGLRSAFHGFVSLEEAGFFRAPWDVEKSWVWLFWRDDFRIMFHRFTS
jgi:AcrR family transcriptional regulator